MVFMHSQVFGFDELRDLYPFDPFFGPFFSSVSNQGAHDDYLLHDRFLFKGSQLWFPKSSIREAYSGISFWRTASHRGVFPAHLWFFVSVISGQLSANRPTHSYIIIILSYDVRLSPLIHQFVVPLSQIKEVSCQSASTCTVSKPTTQLKPTCKQSRDSASLPSFSHMYPCHFSLLFI